MKEAELSNNGETVYEEVCNYIIDYFDTRYIKM